MPLSFIVSFGITLRGKTLGRKSDILRDDLLDGPLNSDLDTRLHLTSRNLRMFYIWALQFNHSTMLTVFGYLFYVNLKMRNFKCFTQMGKKFTLKLTYPFVPLGVSAEPLCR
jgi:hypothetical protein